MSEPAAGRSAGQQREGMQNQDERCKLHVIASSAAAKRQALVAHEADYVAK